MSQLRRRVRPARILVVDDHPMVREGIAVRLERESDLESCGEVASLEEALARVKETRPDLVIVDLALSDGHGLDLIKQLRARDSNLKLLAHSMYDDKVYAQRALQAGAMGYVNKRESAERLLEGIRQVLAGEVFLSPAVQGLLLQRAVGGAEQLAATPGEVLSDRELEVFELLGQGLTTSDVAQRLFLSVHTIETHREKIKRKLNLKNGAQLQQRAVQWVLENA